jgi:hypothetical protein
MPLSHIASRVPDYRQLPPSESMQARTDALRALSRPDVLVREIGRSRTGAAIDMITIGSGPMHVLLVGTPHPNEPIGCLTIEFLIETLIADAALCNASGCTWHFVKTIEPDGLVLNEGWLARPGDASAYFANFFRPALDEQAEYTFPLCTPTYSFDEPVAENMAYREALRIAKPDLLFSLHNAEYGGVFYVVSREVPGLLPNLGLQPARFGARLDEIGELGGELEPLAPGVFKGPDFAAWVERMGAANTWRAGQSVFGQCALAATFVVTVETPYWHDASPPADDGPVALSEALADMPAWQAEGLRLMDAHLDSLAATAAGQDVRFVRALSEAQTHVRRYLSQPSSLPAVPLAAVVARDLKRAMRLASLRAPSMLARLARRIAEQEGPSAPSARAAHEQASACVAAALGEPWLAQGLQPFPLRAAVAMQVQTLVDSIHALRESAPAPGAPGV